MSSLFSAPRRRLRRILFITSLIAISGGLILAVYWGYPLYVDLRHLLNLRTHARSLLVNRFSPETIPQACDLTTQAATDVTRIRSDLLPLQPFIHTLSNFPAVGGYLRQLDPALEYMDNLSHAGLTLCQASSPVWKALTSSTADPNLESRTAAFLLEKQPDFARAASMLAAAGTAKSRIDARFIPEHYRDDFQSLDNALRVATQAIKLLQDIPPAMDLVTRAQALQAQGLNPQNLPQIHTLAGQAVDLIARVKVDIGPLSPFFRQIPPSSQAGRALSQIGPALDYLDELGHAGLVLTNAFMPLVQADPKASSSPPIDFQTKVTRLLVESQPQFAQAADLLRKAADARARIDFSLLPAKARSEVEKIDTLIVRAGPLLELLRTSPGLFGSDIPQTYLILVQNRDELRATGGYVTAFGLLRLDEGRISMLEIDDSSWFNYVSEVRKPPEPLGTIMEASYLVPRDANWSPDFPTTAREMEEMYAISTEIPTDGVIAFDQSLLVDLLQFLGPITIPDQNLTVDANNIQAVMLQYKQTAITNGEPDHRKDILAILAPALIARVNAVHQPAQQGQLVKHLLALTRSGHLQVYFNNSQAQVALHRLNLDGAVDPGAGDFLMVVDSNLGFSKVDQFIDRSLKYRVDLSDPQNLAATVVLKYELTRAGTEPCHQGKIDDSSPTSIDYDFVRCYINYWRLYVPQETQLKKAVFAPVPLSFFDEGYTWKNEIDISPGENHTIVLGGLAVVSPRQTKEIALNTQPPPAILQTLADGRRGYHLRVRKQAGIQSLPLEIRVVPPRGYRLITLPDHWTAGQGQDLYVWKGNCTGTQDFTLEFIPK